MEKPQDTSAVRTEGATTTADSTETMATPTMNAGRPTGDARPWVADDDGSRKAAVLLASLPEADAEYLLRQLDEPQLVSICKASRSAPFQSEEQSKILREMLNTHTMSRLPNHRECTHHNSTSETTGSESRAAFAEMAEAPVETLVRLLADELPQTIAVVLANMDPRRAADVLERLPTEKQLPTTVRIAQLDLPDPTALLHVATAMAERLDEMNSPPSHPIGGPVHVARIVRHLSSATEKALLANVGQESGTLEKSVERHLSVLRQLSSNVPTGLCASPR